MRRLLELVCIGFYLVLTFFGGLMLIDAACGGSAFLEIDYKGWKAAAATIPACGAIILLMSQKIKFDASVGFKKRAKSNSSSLTESAPER